MLKHLSKSITILLLLNTLVACSNPTPQQANVKNDTPSLPNPELVKAESPIIEEKVVEKPIVDAKVVDTKIEDASIPMDMEQPKYNPRLAPKGEDCRNYFDKDSFDETQAKGNPFVAGREYFVFKEGITQAATVRIGYLPNFKKLALIITVFGDKRVCLDKDSLLAITLIDRQEELTVFSFESVHNSNCGTSKKKQDKLKKATGIYLLPVDSFFYQRALYENTRKFVLEVNNGNAMGFNYLEDKHSKDFLNGLRCAYEAIGETEIKTTFLINNILKAD